MKVFGDFEFDEGSLQLRRAGTPVTINGQCLDLLVLMIHRSGELITREEIAQRLWPDGTAGFEHRLDVLVNRLRKALGDGGRNPRYIQTIPRKGYRFAQSVRTEPSDCEAPAGPVRNNRIGRYAALAVLAVLLALLFAHTRYPKAVPHHASPEPTQLTRSSETIHMPD